MDMIERAIAEKPYLCGADLPKEQTWESFKRQSEGKKLFLFGSGGGMEYFLRNCCNHMKIEGIIDNNAKKHNLKLGWSNAEAWNTEYEEMVIDSPSVLGQYHEQNIVVLITVINGYESIMEQLRQMGITKLFVLLIMEVNRRKGLKYSIEEDYDERKSKYIDWCCGQKIEKNKIVMRIGEYGGHAKRITIQLLRLNRDLDIVWLVHEPGMKAPMGIRLVPEKNWKRYIYEMETARMWLFDVNVPEFIIKRKKQIYIQVKHWSSITLKKFYLDDKSSCVSSETAERIRRDGARMDYLFSGSRMDEESCRSGFAFQGKAVRLGSARSDILFDRTMREKVLKQFKLQEDTHILLYAPTYRQKGLTENHRMPVTLKMDSLLDILRDKWGGKWCLLVRLHPWIDFMKSGLTESKDIRNAGDYPESEELVAASDVMITDYSSIMFEGAYVKKPVFLYAPDKREYIDAERGLLLDYNTLPFPIAESNEQLRKCIMEFDRSKYEEDVCVFLNQYGVHEDGYAGERAAKFIMELIENWK